jgi:hypothetical protein
MTDPRLPGPIEKSDRGYRHVQRRVLELRRSGRLPYGWISDGGQSTAVMIPHIDTALLAHVRRRCRENPDTGCWLWAGSLNRTGYNNTIPWPRYLGGDGKQRHAHALAYIAIKGPVPEGLEIDHLCRDRKCASPGTSKPSRLR